MEAEINYYNFTYGKIHYVKTGEGPSLLLIHDLCPGANLTDFRGLIKFLSKSYTVYALDLLGYGDSQKPNISYSSYMYAKLIGNFLKDVVKEPAYAVAKGFSAPIAAVSETLHPGSIKKLMLLNPKNMEGCPVITAILNTPFAGDCFYSTICTILNKNADKKGRYTFAALFGGFLTIGRKPFKAVKIPMRTLRKADKSAFLRFFR